MGVWVKCRPDDKSLEYIWWRIVFRHLSSRSIRSGYLVCPLSPCLRHMKIRPDLRQANRRLSRTDVGFLVFSRKRRQLREPCREDFIRLFVCLIECFCLRSWHEEPISPPEGTIDDWVGVTVVPSPSHTHRSPPFEHFYLSCFLLNSPDLPRRHPRHQWERHDLLSHRVQPVRG